MTNSTERRYMVCRFSYTARVMWRVWDLRDARYVETIRAEEGLTDFRTEGSAQDTADYLNAMQAV